MKKLFTLGFSVIFMACMVSAFADGFTKDYMEINKAA